MSIVDLYEEVTTVNANGDVVKALIPKPCSRCTQVSPDVHMRVRPGPPDGDLVYEPLCANCAHILAQSHMIANRP